MQTAWIPEKYAKRGKVLEIQDDDGWEVISASIESLSYEDANTLSQDYKRTRKASDI